MKNPTSELITEKTHSSAIFMAVYDWNTRAVILRLTKLDVDVAVIRTLPDNTPARNARFDLLMSKKIRGER